MVTPVKIFGLGIGAGLVLAGLWTRRAMVPGWSVREEAVLQRIGYCVTALEDIVT